MAISSRECHLKSRPQGVPTHDNFEIVTVQLPDPGPGEVQVKNLWMTVDPYMRGRMNDESYSPLPSSWARPCRAARSARLPSPTT